MNRPKIVLGRNNTSMTYVVLPCTVQSGVRLPSTRGASMYSTLYSTRTGVLQKHSHQPFMSPVPYMSLERL